jgi:dolichol-phosphate mannosyltransferase
MSAFAAMVGITQTIFVLWASLTHRVVPGWSSMMIIVAFFGAMQSLSIGILGEYLLRIQFRDALPLFVRSPGQSATDPADAVRNAHRDQ